tara:strand:- start:9396 stop:9584 length:189 start_codon:yes stop_codon:yes gene_type:complete
MSLRLPLLQHPKGQLCLPLLFELILLTIQISNNGELKDDFGNKTMPVVCFRYGNDQKLKKTV